MTNDYGRKLEKLLGETHETSEVFAPGSFGRFSSLQLNINNDNPILQVNEEKRYTIQFLHGERAVYDIDFRCGFTDIAIQESIDRLI